MKRTVLSRRLGRALRVARTACELGLSVEEVQQRLLEDRRVRPPHPYPQAMLTRRALLCGGLSLLGAVAGCHPQRAAPRPPPPGSAPAAAPAPPFGSPQVIILGAGLAGLCAAYRLMQAGVPAVIYEGRERAGGRVLTRPGFNADRQFCELGAELVDTANAALHRLCGELGVPTEEFTAADRGLARELLYFGGRRYTEEQLLSGVMPLMQGVLADLRRIWPRWPRWPRVRPSAGEGDGLRTALADPAALRRFDHLSLAAYFEERRANAEAWVLDALEVAFRGEYGLDLSDQSALNFLLSCDTDLSDGYDHFGESDEAWRIKGGSSALVAALLRRLAGRVPIFFGHVLGAVQVAPSGLRLRFRRAGAASVDVVAEQVLCALPFSTLREVEGVAALPLSPRKRRAIAELGYGTNAKFMLGYRERPWRHAGSPRGADPALPPWTGAVLTDLPGGQYWETSRLQPGRRGILTNYLGGRVGACVDGAWAGTALADLSRIHPALTELHDGSVAFSCWAREALSRGSYTCLRPGQYTAFHGVEGEPELAGRLLFCGEHCSATWQGFMNGAIESAERAVARITGQRGAPGRRMARLSLSP
jgi:monoamine oxidase